MDIEAFAMLDIQLAAQVNKCAELEAKLSRAEFERDEAREQASRAMNTMLIARGTSGLQYDEIECDDCRTWAAEANAYANETRLTRDKIEAVRSELENVKACWHSNVQALKATDDRLRQYRRWLDLIVKTSSDHPGSVALDRCIAEIGQDLALEVK